MIKNFLITGDTHGRVMERLSHMENKTQRIRKTLTQRVIQFTALEVIMKSARKIFLL